MKSRKILTGIIMAFTATAYLLSGDIGYFTVFTLILAYVSASVIFLKFFSRVPKIKIDVPSFLEKNERADFEIYIENSSLVPISLVKIFIEVKNKVTEEKRQIFLIFSLGSKKSLRERISMKDEYCGAVEVTVSDIRISDSFKIFEKSFEGEKKGMGLIVPHIGKTIIPKEYLDTFNMESYTYSQYKKGSELGEVFGIRDYESGDSLKAVHWKISAKVGELTVKIPSFPIENNIALILDKHLYDSERLSYKQKNDLMEMYFTVSHTLIQRDISHSLGFYNGENKVFEIKKIDSVQDIWEIMEDILSSGFEEDRVSTVYKFLEAMEDGRFSNYLVVTRGILRDREKLERYGAVNLFGIR